MLQEKLVPLESTLPATSIAFTAMACGPSVSTMFGLLLVKLQAPDRIAYVFRHPVAGLRERFQTLSVHSRLFQCKKILDDIHIIVHRVYHKRRAELTCPQLEAENHT